MTTYKNEKSHKKLLVPVVALVLCAAAMIGLGYAALVSDVTNTDNVVAAEGLTATLTDGSGGSLLAAGGFDATAEDIVYNNSQNNGTNYYKVAAQDLVLGGATLNIHVTDPTVTSVSMYYVITWTDAAAPATYGITTDLDVGTQNVLGTATSSAPTTVTLTADAAGATGQDFTLVLNGTVAGSDTLTTKPIDLTYTITIYVSPITV